jgi:Flp pilus assembly protein TadD
MIAPPPPSAAKVQAALHEATIHYQAGRLAEAEKICRRILLEYPTNPETNMSLAIVLKDQGKLAEAELSFRRVVDLVPNASAAHNDLGNILFAQDKLADAEAAYRRALVPTFLRA